MLEPHHLRECLESGLSEEYLEEAGVYSEIQLEPLGFSDSIGLSMVFTYYDLSGNIIFHRIKPDRKVIFEGKPAKYLSPKKKNKTDQGSFAYFVKSVADKINNKTLKSVLITEGEKKTLKANLEGFDCIGLSGVNCWQHNHKLLPDLAAIEWRGVQVTICFDSDSAHNARVASAEQALAKALVAKGAIVRIARIPSPDGKKYGIDDYIVAFGRSAFVDVLEAAEAVAGQTRTTLMDFLRDHPSLKPVVIEGLLRRGETCNIIAAPKIGKSYMALGLLWAVVTGKPWLGRSVTKGRVLIIDNELEPGLITNRLVAVACAMDIDASQYADQIEIVSLRGQMADIDAILAKCEQYQPGEFTLVVLDALYRTLPEGKSENDNAHMMAVYSRLDAMTARLDAALVVVHHTSKGDQSGKSVTDIGSGAGSISRAADTHITIRPHERDEYAVMEAVTRSFPSPDPRSISWTYPLWEQSATEPVVRTATVLKAKQKEETDSQVVNSLTRPMILGEIRSATGFQYGRATDALKRLQEQGRVICKQDGKRILYERVG